MGERETAAPLIPAEPALKSLREAAARARFIEDLRHVRRYLV